jgi:4-amino-4-deoxy-L-arabinose transferase-like glycosyltransferase
VPSVERRLPARPYVRVLNSSGLAVVATFLVRMLFFRLYHHVADTGLVSLPTGGLETERVAWSVASGHGFAGLWVGLPGPTAWLAPVYPYLLALVYKISGMDFSMAHNLAQTINCAFSAATCWPIYAVGKKIFHQRIGLASAWVWVFLPTAIQMPLEWIWDQSLSALLLCLLLCVTLQLRENSSPLKWAAYGLFWALAALTNPSLCVLLPFFLGWLFFQRRRNGLNSQQLVVSTVLLFILGLLPWTIRNYRVMGTFIPVKSNLGMELWLGNNPGVKHVWTPKLNPLASPEELRPLMEVGEVKYNRLKEKAAIAFIRENPGVFLRLTLERFLDAWTAKYEIQTERWVVALHVGAEYEVFYSLFSVLAIAGMVLATRAHGTDSLPLSFCLVFFPMIYYVTHTRAHYRHPIDPVMTILSVYAVGYLWPDRTTGDRTLQPAGKTRGQS